jgi:hypothetical protein
VGSYRGVLSQLALGDGMVDTPEGSTFGVKRISVVGSGIEVCIAP